MELKKIREMSEAELNAELSKMKKDLFNLRFQHVTGQLERCVKRRETSRESRPLSGKRNSRRFRANGKEDVLWQLKETEERQESAWS